MTKSELYDVIGITIFMIGIGLCAAGVLVGLLARTAK